MDLVLLPAFRGRGVGTAATIALLGHVQSRLGWRRFTVDPDADNTRGIEFWTKAGFRPVRLIEDDDGRKPYWLMEWPYCLKSGTNSANGTEHTVRSGLVRTGQQAKSSSCPLGELSIHPTEPTGSNRRGAR